MMTVICSNDNNVKSGGGAPDKKSSVLNSPSGSLGPNRNQSPVVHIMLANKVILYVRYHIQCWMEV